MRRVLYLMWKEFLELRQDPRIFPIVFAAPIIQLTLLGYAATTDVCDVPTLVVDVDRSAESRALMNRFEFSPYFTVVRVESSTAAIDDPLLRGEAWMALTIPAGYGEALRRGETARVQLVADGSDANSAGIGLGYATNLVASYAAEILAERAPAAPRGGALALDVRVWFNPELQSRMFMIPGVLALILLVVTTILTSMAIVREKEVGTLEQLNVTPMRRWELVGGKLLPYALIGVVDVLLVSAVAIGWFHVPLRGSFALLFGMSLVFVLNTLGIGLFVSTISRTQQQAMIIAAFFFMMPMTYLSGFIFPIENMPQAVQWSTYAIPLRYYLVIVRGIFLKGVGLETLWPQALALLGCGVIILSLAVLRSTKRAG